MLLFLMGAGLVIGTKISLAFAAAIAGTLRHQSPRLPAWVIWPAIAVLGVSLLGVIQAPLSASIHVSAGACLLAWAVYSLVNAPPWAMWSAPLPVRWRSRQPATSITT
jgi:hypothetical protein